jgi:hypothetical protein
MLKIHQHIPFQDYNVVALVSPLHHSFVVRHIVIFDFTKLRSFRVLVAYNGKAYILKFVNIRWLIQKVKPTFFLKKQKLVQSNQFQHKEICGG